MLKFLFTIFVVHSCLGSNLAWAGSPPMLPDDVIQDLIRAGALEWVEETMEVGDKVFIPRSFSCKGCGDITFAHEGLQFDGSQSCKDCGTPRTKKKIKWFRLPFETNSTGSKIKYLKPTDMSQSVASKQAIADFLKLRLENCDYCQRLNPVKKGATCHGCGNPTHKHKEPEKPKKKKQGQKLSQNKKNSARMQERMEKRNRVLGKVKPQDSTDSPRSEAQEKTVAAGDPEKPSPKTQKNNGSSNAKARPSFPASSTNMKTPRVVGGALGAVAVVGAVIGVQYLRAQNEIHTSIGEVIEVNGSKALVKIHGLKNIELDTRNEDQLIPGQSIPSETFNFEVGDLIEVGWSEDQGVISLVPHDLNYISGEGMEQ